MFVFQYGGMVCLVQADRITVQDENEPKRFKSGLLGLILTI